MVFREDDVVCNWRGSTSATIRKVRNRAMDIRSWSLEMRHPPSGIVLRGSVPPGNYSKRQMKELKAGLQAALMADMRTAVGKEKR